MMTNKKYIVDGIVRLRAKEIYGYNTQDQENVKLQLACIFYRAIYRMKNVKFAGFSGSVGQEAMKEFCKFIF